MAWQLAAAAIQGGMSFLKGRSAAKKAKKLARQQAAQYRAIGRYNSAIVQLNTRIERMQIKEQGDRLSKQQRELKAQQRMSIRGRGGIMGGGDLLQVIESANEMQTDLFQIMRTSALAQLSGDVKSNQILFSKSILKTHLSLCVRGSLGAPRPRALGPNPTTQTLRFDSKTWLASTLEGMLGA